jgi:hypothetical protein
MIVGSDHYLVNAKILFLYGKSNTNEPKENITDCAIELVQPPIYNIDSLKEIYNIDSLKDESTRFL